jgi:hypothetical protein
MSLLSGLNIDESLKENDSVGMGKVKSGLYDSEITMAYLKKATSGALAVVVHLKSAAGEEVKGDLYFQSGNDKGNKTYSENTSGVRKNLTGFDLSNSLCLLSVGTPLAQTPTELKTVKIYNFEAKADVPQEVEVLTPLIGQRIIAGIQLQTVDKEAKGADGQYAPTGETRDQNEIDKFFRAADRLTVAEIMAESTEPAFYSTWGDKWNGVTRNRSKGVKSGAGSAGGQAASAATKPAKSLFAAPA